MVCAQESTLVHREEDSLVSERNRAGVFLGSNVGRRWLLPARFVLRLLFNFRSYLSSFAAFAFSLSVELHEFVRRPFYMLVRFSLSL